MTEGFGYFIKVSISLPDQVIESMTDNMGWAVNSIMKNGPMFHSCFTQPKKEGVSNLLTP